MKTAGSFSLKLPGLKFPGLLALAGLLFPAGADAARNVSLDVDARARAAEGGRRQAQVHLVGLALRETFADRRGDRLILFGVAEAENDFSDVMLHELYATYKGKLGGWSATAGRFILPYGLLPGFDATRLLYDTAHEALLGMESDNGIRVSLTAGALDYALSLTQGYGHHHRPGFPGHGIAAARIGLTPGETEELSIGLSAAYGRTADHHDRDMGVLRALAAADATFYLGRWLGRIEFSAGRIAAHALGAAFAGFDYALLPGLDLNLAATVMRHGGETSDIWYTGVTLRPRWFTIRGGYRYAGSGEERHEVVFQAYRLFSFNY